MDRPDGLDPPWLEASGAERRPPAEWSLTRIYVEALFEHETSKPSVSEAALEKKIAAATEALEKVMALRDKLMKDKEAERREREEAENKVKLVALMAAEKAAAEASAKLAAIKAELRAHPAPVPAPASVSASVSAPVSAPATVSVPAADAPRECSPEKDRSEQRSERRTEGASALSLGREDHRAASS